MTADEGKVHVQDRRDGAIVGAAREERRLRLHTRVPLTGLRPGLYVLKVEARSRLGSGPTAESRRCSSGSSSRRVDAGVEMTGDVIAMLGGAAADARCRPSPPPVRSLGQGRRERDRGAAAGDVRDRDAWASLWRAHAPRRPAPAVDFSREMVVGVFMGTRPTAGFAVEIVGYRDSGERTSS